MVIKLPRLQPQNLIEGVKEKSKEDKRDSDIVYPPIKKFALKLYIQKKRQIGARMMKFYAVEKHYSNKHRKWKTKPFLLTHESSIKKLSQFCKWLYDKFGEGWYKVSFFRKGTRGPLPFFFGLVSKDSYQELKRKGDEDTKDIEDLKIEYKESIDDPEYQNIIKEEIEMLREEQRCKKSMQYPKYLIYYKPRWEAHPLEEY